MVYFPWFLFFVVRCREREREGERISRTTTSRIEPCWSGVHGQIVGNERRKNNVQLYNYENLVGNHREILQFTYNEPPVLFSFDFSHFSFSLFCVCLFLPLFFITGAHSKEVPEPLQNGDQWQVPYSLADGRVDDGANIYDVIFSSVAIKKAVKAPEWRDLLSRTALAAVAGKVPDLDTESWIPIKNTAFKGSKPGAILRQAAEAADSSLSELRMPGDDGGKGKERLIVEEPKYKLVHVVNGEDADRPVKFDFHPVGRPDALKIVIELPKMSRASDATLHIAPTLLTLGDVEEPPRYSLSLPLPFAVDEESGSAQFDTATSTLTITLPTVVTAPFLPPSQHYPQEQRPATKPSPPRGRRPPSKEGLNKILAPQPMKRRVSLSLGDEQSHIPEAETSVTPRLKSPPPPPAQPRPIVTMDLTPEEAAAHDADMSLHERIKSPPPEPALPEEGYAADSSDNDSNMSQFESDTDDEAKAEQGKEPVPEVAADADDDVDDEVDTVEGLDGPAMAVGYWDKDVPEDGRPKIPLIEWMQSRKTVSGVVRVEGISSASVVAHFLPTSLEVTFGTGAPDFGSYGVRYSLPESVKVNQCSFSVNASNMVIILMKETASETLARKWVELAPIPLPSPTSQGSEDKAAEIEAVAEVETSKSEPGVVEALRKSSVLFELD